MKINQHFHFVVTLFTHPHMTPAGVIHFMCLSQSHPSKFQKHTLTSTPHNFGFFFLHPNCHSIHLSFSICRFESKNQHLLIISIYHCFHFIFRTLVEIRCFPCVLLFILSFYFVNICFYLFNRGAKKDPYSERKKPVKKYHSMKSPKYLVSKKIQPQHRLASQIGNS